MDYWQVDYWEDDIHGEFGCFVKSLSNVRLSNDDIKSPHQNIYLNSGETVKQKRLSQLWTRWSR